MGSIPIVASRDRAPFAPATGLDTFFGVDRAETALDNYRDRPIRREAGGRGLPQLHSSANMVFRLYRGARRCLSTRQSNALTSPSVQRSTTPSLLRSAANEFLSLTAPTIGYGVPPMPDFWIGPNMTGDDFRESHIAFNAPDRAAVDSFFTAGITAGAVVLHEPRVWPEYHPNYYGCVYS